MHTHMGVHDHTGSYVWADGSKNYMLYHNLLFMICRDVSSHGMIGLFRMIILLAGQIILNTRMIGRDDKNKKNVDFWRFLTSEEGRWCVILESSQFQALQAVEIWPKVTKRVILQSSYNFSQSVSQFPVPDLEMFEIQQECKVFSRKIGGLEYSGFEVVILPSS